MLDTETRARIARLVKREVLPATGCTEPAAVALATARAVALLGCQPARIHASLSPNVLKNAMGVGLPGTSLTGLPAAIALGAAVGDASLGLEVLRHAGDPGTSERVAPLLKPGRITVGLEPEGCDKLQIRVTVTDPSGREATAMIRGEHTHFVYLACDGRVELDERAPAAASAASAATTPDEKPLSLAMVWEWAMESPIDELRFILDTRRINKAAAEMSFAGRYGHSVGRTLHSERQRRVMGDSIFSRILSYTAAACDARMAGACIPVMSNSGSGNQGISATLPVAIYAEETFADEEATTRALALSHLTVIYIKQSLGRLSALCGCVVAATGSACGICYLMGGDYSRVVATVKNMVGNITGMICDGAKPGCAMKVTSGATSAVISAMLAMEGHCVSAVEGIIDDDVDRTVANLAAIGHDAMNETDRLVLSIMTSKS